LLKLIEGGLSARDGALCSVKDRVYAEGQRRIEAAGVARYQARERLTGLPMPHHLKVLKLQIEFATSAIATLSPLPADYMSDRYWPALEARATTGEATRVSG
jgi:hypothetical protein